MLNLNSHASHGGTRRELHVADYHEISLDERLEHAANGGKMLLQDWSTRDLFITTLLQFVTNGSGGITAQGWTDVTSLQGS